VGGIRFYGGKVDDDDALDTDDFAVCAPERRGKKSVIRQRHTWRSY
jgi:hypothetical protein